MVAALFSAFHLLTLAAGLAAVWTRGRALRGELDGSGFQRLFAADNLWGIAAASWLATGLGRILLGVEKGWTFYLYNGFFWLKMALFVLIIGIEIWPMITLIRWRITRSRGEEPDTRPARTLARLNDVEVGLTVLIPFVAAAMARGLWMIPA